MNNVRKFDGHLSNHVEDFPDFPKPGILFKDIMPLLANPKILHQTIYTLCEYAQKIPTIDAFIGIESRGFLLATPMAYELEKGFIAARKKGKLPGKVGSETYDLEYGTDTIEIQHTRIEPGKHYVIVDDLLATGGTALATAKLVKKQGGTVSGFIFLVELADLNGRKKILAEFPNISCESLITY